MNWGPLACEASVITTRPTERLLCLKQPSPFAFCRLCKIISAAGTRTRVSWVKAKYPNQLDYRGLVESAPNIRQIKTHNHSKAENLEYLKKNRRLHVEEAIHDRFGSPSNAVFTFKYIDSTWLSTRVIRASHVRYVMCYAVLSYDSVTEWLRCWT